MTDEDFTTIVGSDRKEDDAYVFDIKVIKRDITCKNGYVHVLGDVMIPPMNMAEYLRDKENLSVFSSLVERFSAPYYREELSANYKVLHPEFNDSIYEKRLL